MTFVYAVFLLLAAGCFIASAFGRVVGRPDRPLNLISLGLFFWVLVPLIETARALD